MTRAKRADGATGGNMKTVTVDAIPTRKTDTSWQLQVDTTLIWVPKRFVLLPAVIAAEDINKTIRVTLPEWLYLKEMNKRMGGNNATKTN